MGTRTGGVLRAVSLTRMDQEILAFLTRFGFARPHQVAGWVGGSPFTVRDRLTRLAGNGYVNRFTVSIDLVGVDGAIRPGDASVWEPTVKGAVAAGSWVVPGTGQEVSLSVSRPSRAMADHVLAVADLAVWYRRAGFLVAAEREILSMERPTQLVPGRVVESYWTVKVPGRTGVHPPDLGVVAPDRTMWAIELERAVKTVRTYAEVVTAYRSVGMGQVWHILGKATSARVQEACMRAGVTWAEQTIPGVLVSTDGLVRLQGWRPGRTGLVSPKQWAHQVPVSMPAGFPDPGVRYDPSVTWRRDQVVDVDSVPMSGVVR